MIVVEVHSVGLQTQLGKAARFSGRKGKGRSLLMGGAYASVAEGRERDLQQLEAKS